MDSNAPPPEETVTPPDQVSTTPPPPAGQPPALTRLATVGNIPGSSGTSYDIVEIYHQLLRNDLSLAMPIAAIESLIEVLANSNESTVAGTLSVLKEQSDFLKARVPNSISLSAGCDLFQQYLITTLRNSSGNFEDVKQHLLKNGKKFVQRAKDARNKIAAHGRFLIRNKHTVLTHGGSRCVGALLLRAAAADAGPRGELIDFKVIYVLNGGRMEESLDIVASLRAKGIPVATVPEAAIGYVMHQVTSVFVGAEGVVESGGIISRLGTYQIGVLAKAAGKPFYVAAETHKFIRLYPLGQTDLPVKQKVIDFKTGDDKGQEEEKKFADQTDYFDTPAQPYPELHDAVDYTFPKYISAIITENGVLTPSAVSEELIKIYA